MRLSNTLFGLASLASLAAVQGLGEQRVITFPNVNLDSDRIDGAAAAGDAPAQAVLSVPSQTHGLLHGDFLIASKHKHKHKKHATPLLLDSNDNEAIHLAAQTFARDVYWVTGVRPELYNDTLPKGTPHAIVVGSVDSDLIKGVKGGEEIKQLQGKWESYDVRVREYKGLEKALVVVGSDRRGTVYALYTLSEQMGISPFHYWADVPVRKHDAIAFSADKHLTHGEPTVKYRGLFINDEHPAMYGWASQKWNVSYGDPALVTDMYEPWFEMMLRLKANYFWPAMYASMFDVDGMDISDGLPQPPAPGPNQVLANKMGIVMGTSHHEPMSRNKPEWDLAGKGPWDWTNDEFLTDWWKYGAKRADGMETMFTLGMRGDGDMPLTGASNELVENITATQQGILRDVYGDISGIPQMWCMYKEVAEYFVKGLKVPEDVSILFADDNYGNIMSVLPPGMDHKAGAGIYYHVDYVGMPRAYKWINTINLAKTWEQMSIARAFNTTSIWILNIGTLKPLELPTEHFLSLAWDLDAWPINSVDRFLHEWAAREFGQDVSGEVADIMSKYSMYSSRRKAELMNSTTWSLVHFEEAERVLGEWEDLTTRAGKVYDGLPDETKPAFYELVYMLCLMQTNLNRLYIAASRSNLYAAQGRTAANVYAKEAIDAFFHDANLTESFHSLLDRRWDHMLDQSHINWNSWLEPMKDSLPPISMVNPMQPSRQGIPIPEREYGVTTSVRVTMQDTRGSWPGNTIYNCPSGEHCTNSSLMPMSRFGTGRWIEVGAGGPKDVSFEVKTSEEWIKVEPNHGKIKRDASQDIRLRVSIDWEKVESSMVDPQSAKQFGEIHIYPSDGFNVTITVPIELHDAPPSGYYVESDGYVAIEAAHYAKNTSEGEYAFQEIKGYGRTLSGLEMFPMTTQNFTVGEGPSLEYDFWTYDHPKAEDGNDASTTAGASDEIIIQIGPSLNFFGVNNTLAFGVSLDDSSPRIINPIPTEPLGMYKINPDMKPVAIGAVPKDWIDIVKEEIRNVRLPIDSFKSTDAALAEGQSLKAGKHTLKIWGMTTGLIFERVLVDRGGIRTRPSYLGPPESVKA